MTGIKKLITEMIAKELQSSRSSSLQKEQKDLPFLAKDYSEKHKRKKEKKEKSDLPAVNLKEEAMGEEVKRLIDEVAAQITDSSMLLNKVIFVLQESENMGEQEIQMFLEKMKKDESVGGFMEEGNLKEGDYAILEHGKLVGSYSFDVVDKIENMLQKRLGNAEGKYSFEPDFDGSEKAMLFVVPEYVNDVRSILKKIGLYADIDKPVGSLDEKAAPKGLPKKKKK